LRLWIAQLRDAKSPEIESRSSRPDPHWMSALRIERVFVVMGSINVASCGLFIGGTGQGLFFAYLFPIHPGTSTFNLLNLVLLIPWLTVFAISFCNRPPVGPRQFRLVLIFAMCWYSTVMLLAEMFCLALHAVPHGNYPLWVPRILMYLGALSFVVFVRACIVLRRLDVPVPTGG